MFCGITLLMSLFVYSNSQCVNVQNNVTYYTSKGEQIRWRADSLIKGNGLTYNLTPSSTVMRYHPAFDQISDQEEHYGALYKVYALRAYDIASTGAWANKFAFLEREEGKYIYDIYYTEGNVIHMDHTPQFTAKVILSDKTDNLFECFDLEYINPELWIVDCVQMYADGTPLENYIYFVNKTDSPQTIKPKRIQTPNHKNYKSIKGRKIQYHTYYKQDIGEGESIDLPEPKHPIRIMLRGQQAFNSETGTPDVLDQDCFIDVILRLENKTTYDTEQVLNKSRISTDTGRTVNFTLIDFKILPNGDVYILDAYEGIYVYRVTEEGNWKYLRTIQTMIGRAYAFDVNNRLLNDGFSYLHIAVVYESNMLTFINGKQQNGYRLPFSSTYPLTVSLSQQYVVIVHNQYLYLYNSEKPYLLHKELLISQTVLVNPYAPDVVLVSNIFTRRYELSDGYLASENSDAIEQTSRTFTATDGTNTCKAVITYQVLSTSNNHVLPLGHDPFPTMITYPAIPFVLQDIASGPNLQFITPDVHNTHVEVKVHFLWELDVKEIQWFDAKDVIYADVLVDPHHETTNKFYLFLQHKNKTVIVWDCLTVNYNDHHCTCEKEVQINLPIGLSRINSQFGWNSFDKDDLTFQFLVSDYEIQIWDAYNGEPEKIGNITFAEKPENKITSFTALKKNVFIVHEQSKEIDVVSAIYPKLQSYPIDKDLMDSYETGCSWTPKRVYGNPTTKSEFVWIVTDDCVIMGDQRYHFTLIDAFPIPEKYEVEVAVGEKTFYIITTTTNNNGSIREYNYENLNDIYLMKFMPLYDKYRLQTPLTIDFAYETGFLFVRALDIEDNKTVFLIYESNILYRDCLHKVVKTGELIPDGQLIETAASGYDQMFVYFNDLKTEHIFVVLRDSLMDLHPTAISDAYATQLTAAVSISNTFSTEPPVNIKYPVKFINTQSIVRVNETVLYKTENHFESITTQQYINLTNNGWYWGHVTRFTIKCRQCETHLVDILDPVTHGSEGSFFANYEFIDGATFQTSVVYLTDQSLVFQNDNDTLKFVQKIDGIQYCNSLTTFNQYIMVSCVNNKAEALIYIFNCDLANQKCTPVEPQSQVLPKIQIISKLVYLNNVLYVLDLDQSNPRHYQGSLHVFSLTLDNQWSIKNEQILDAKYFGFTEDQEFYISDFDVVQFQIGNTNYYKIMIQTTVEKTYFVQMYSDNGLLKYNHKDSLNLANLLNTDYAIKSDTYFYQIRAQKSGVANNLLTITALITTNNVAQYAITFSFDVTDPLNKGSPVKNSITVPYLLNHYGTFLAINKLTIGQGHAAVAYTNYTHLLIAIYKLPDLSIEGEDGVTKMLTMTGSEVVEYWRPGTSFVMVLQKDPVYGEPVMYANLFESLKTSNHLLVKYTIHDFPRIIIYDGTKVESQWVELGIANDFSEALGIFEIINKGQPPTPPEPENKTSLTWLWITLGVIGGLIVVGGVGFVVYTKFYKRTTPHVTDSAKVSLMQQ